MGGFIIVTNNLPILTIINDNLMPTELKICRASLALINFTSSNWDIRTKYLKYRIRKKQMKKILKIWSLMDLLQYCKTNI